MQKYLKHLTTTWATAWNEARLDLAAERELRICEEVNAPYSTRAKVDAQGRLCRFLFDKRSKVEGLCYRWQRIGRFFNHAERRREWAEIGKRKGVARVNALIPYL